MRNLKSLLFLTLLIACGPNNVTTGEESFPVTIELVPPGPRDGDLVQIRWTTKVSQRQGNWSLICQDIHGQDLLREPLPFAEGGWRGTVPFSAPVSTRNYTCTVRNSAQDNISNVLQFAP